MSVVGEEAVIEQRPVSEAFRAQLEALSQAISAEAEKPLFFHIDTPDRLIQQARDEATSTFNAIRNLIHRAQTGEINETKYREIALQLLQLRFNHIKDSVIAYTAHPQHPANRAAIALAKAVCGDAAIITALIPSVRTVIGGIMPTLKDNTEEEGSLQLGRFMLNEAGTALINISGILDYAQSDPKKLLGTGLFALEKIFPVSENELEKIAKMSEKLGACIAQLRQAYAQIDEQGTVYSLLNALQKGLHDSSRYGGQGGDEYNAAMAHLLAPAEKMFELYRGLTEQQRAQFDTVSVRTLYQANIPDNEIPVEVVGRLARVEYKKKRTLKQFLLFIFAKVPEINAQLHEDERAIAAKYRLFPCTAQLSDTASAFIHSEDCRALFGMRIDNQQQRAPVDVNVPAEAEIIARAPSANAQTELSDDRDYQRLMAQVVSGKGIVADFIAAIHEGEAFDNPRIELLLASKTLPEVIAGLDNVQKYRLLQSIGIGSLMSHLNEMLQIILGDPQGAQYAQTQIENLLTSPEAKASVAYIQALTVACPGMTSVVMLSQEKSSEQVIQALADSEAATLDFLNTISHRHFENFIADIPLADAAARWRLIEGLVDSHNIATFILSLSEQKLGEMIANNVQRLQTLLTHLPQAEQAKLLYKLKQQLPELITSQERMRQLYHALPQSCLWVVISLSKPSEAVLASIPDSPAAQAYLKFKAIMQDRDIAPHQTARCLLRDYVRTGWISRFFSGHPNRNSAYIRLINEVLDNHPAGHVRSSEQYARILIDKMITQFRGKTAADWQAEQDDFSTIIKFICALSGYSLTEMFVSVQFARRQQQDNIFERINAEHLQRIFNTRNDLGLNQNLRPNRDDFRDFFERNPDFAARDDWANLWEDFQQNNPAQDEQIINRLPPREDTNRILQPIISATNIRDLNRLFELQPQAIGQAQEQRLQNAITQAPLYQLPQGIFHQPARPASPLALNLDILNNNAEARQAAYDRLSEQQRRLLAESVRAGEIQQLPLEEENPLNIQNSSP